MQVIHAGNVKEYLAKGGKCEISLIIIFYHQSPNTKQKTHIIITAHLVSPVRGDILALPTDRIKPPSEKDLFLYGRTAAGTRTPKQGAAGEVAKQDFSGSYGYVLD